MGIISDFLQYRKERKEQHNNAEVVVLRKDLDAFKKRMEDLYIHVCEKHEVLSNKLYKRVDYLERKQTKQLTPKQNFISQLATRHGLAVQPAIEEEDDENVEEEIEEE